MTKANRPRPTAPIAVPIEELTRDQVRTIALSIAPSRVNMIEEESLRPLFDEWYAVSLRWASAHGWIDELDGNNPVSEFIHEASILIWGV